MLSWYVISALISAQFSMTRDDPLRASPTLYLSSHMLTSLPSQAEASPSILALIAQGDASNLAENKLESHRDRNALVALRALIDSRLSAFEGSPVLEEAAAEVALMQADAASNAEADMEYDRGEAEHYAEKIAAECGKDAQDAQKDVDDEDPEPEAHEGEFGDGVADDEDEEMSEE